jgi:hypothetical protein
VTSSVRRIFPQREISDYIEISTAVLDLVYRGYDVRVIVEGVKDGTFGKAFAPNVSRTSMDALPIAPARQRGNDKKSRKHGK